MVLQHCSLIPPPPAVLLLASQEGRAAFCTDRTTPIGPQTYPMALLSAACAYRAVEVRPIFTAPICTPVRFVLPRDAEIGLFTAPMLVNFLPQTQKPGLL